MFPFNKKSSVALHLAVVLAASAFVLGNATGFLIGQAARSGQKAPVPAAQTGAQPATMPEMALPADPKVISGLVKEIKGGQIIIDSDFPGSDISERTITISENTQIMVNRPMTETERTAEAKDRATRRQEIENYLSGLAAGREYLSTKKQIESQLTGLNNLNARLNALNNDQSIRELLDELRPLEMADSLPDSGYQRVTVVGSSKDLIPGASVTLKSDNDITRAEKIAPLSITVNIPVAPTPDATDPESPSPSAL